MDSKKAEKLFLEFYGGAERQGPGGDEFTSKAFKMLGELPAIPKILDIGCGSGAQTFALTKLTDGEIVAVDFYDFLLAKLRAKITGNNLSHKIHPIKASMFDLPFPENEFDIIWSEGAVYIMGFENGLKTWQKILKPGGYLVVFT